MSLSKQQSLHTSPSSGATTSRQVLNALDQSYDSNASVLQMELLDLNDDCLYHILEYLSLEPLAQLFGQLCQRLDMIIRQICKVKPKNYTISLRHPPPLNANQLEFLGSVLNSFTLDVGFSNEQADVVNILRPICLGGAQSGQLTSLSIKYIYLVDDYLACLSLVAPQLMYLDLRYGARRTELEQSAICNMKCLLASLRKDATVYVTEM